MLSQVEVLDTRILIADDHPLFRAAMRQAMVDIVGDNITEVASFSEAYSAIEADDSLELVFLDLNMPVMDGLEFIERARKENAGRTVPMLLLTTEVAEHLKLRAREVGATGWLTKPFDPVQILQLVDQLA